MSNIRNPFNLNDNRYLLRKYQYNLLSIDIDWKLGATFSTTSFNENILIEEYKHFAACNTWQKVEDLKKEYATAVLLKATKDDLPKFLNIWFPGETEECLEYYPNYSFEYNGKKQKGFTYADCWNYILIPLNEVGEDLLDKEKAISNFRGNSIGKYAPMTEINYVNFLCKYVGATSFNISKIKLDNTISSQAKKYCTNYNKSLKAAQENKKNER